jgi:hypothetical protein
VPWSLVSHDNDDNKHSFDLLINNAQLSYNNYDHHNNNDSLCTNIVEDQAEWRDKIKELCTLVSIVNVRVINGWIKVLRS